MIFEINNNQVKTKAEEIFPQLLNSLYKFDKQFLCEYVLLHDVQSGETDFYNQFQVVFPHG